MVAPGEFAMGQNGKVKLSSVLDQGDDSEVKPLSIEALRDLLDDWKETENDGEEPDEDEEGTGEQITALAFRIQTGATPYADFGVWRPHAADLRRALKFFGYFVGPDGECFKKELAGPASFEEWLCAWRVYCFVMEVLGQANRIRLRRYSDTLKKLDNDYPGLWWIIALADIKMRKSHMERIRRAVVKTHTERVAANLPSDFDPHRPWDVVFREAARSTEYWQREVDKKVVQFTTAQRSRQQIGEPGYGPIRFVQGQLDNGGGQKRSNNGGGGGNGGGGDKGDKKKTQRASQHQRLRAQRDAARASGGAATSTSSTSWAPPPPTGGGGKGKGKGKKGKGRRRQRAEGRGRALLPDGRRGAYLLGLEQGARRVRVAVPQRARPRVHLLPPGAQGLCASVTTQRRTADLRARAGGDGEEHGGQFGLGRRWGGGGCGRGGDFGDGGGRSAGGGGCSGGPGNWWLGDVRIPLDWWDSGTTRRHRRAGESSASHGERRRGSGAGPRQSWSLGGMLWSG